MAEPVGFEGANNLLSGEHMGCRDLEVFTDGEQVISCWRLTDEEREKIAETGVVWLSCLGTPPPVLISGLAMVVIQVGGGEERDPRVEPVLPRRADRE